MTKENLKLMNSFAMPKHEQEASPLTPYKKSK